VGMATCITSPGLHVANSGMHMCMSIPPPNGTLPHWPLLLPAGPSAARATA
jgi:hypothetical protein